MTISFGLRNVADPAAALREFLRVTRPGGRLVVCEFSQPGERRVPQGLLRYLMRALPRVARRVCVEPRLLRLPRRVDPGVARPGATSPRTIQDAGWHDVAWRNLSGGIVALHRATA